MATTVPSTVIKQSQSMVRSWREIDPEMKFGKMTLKQLEDALTESLDHREMKATLKTQTKDRSQRQINADRVLWALVKRGRAGSKSDFGDDAKEYAMFGGKRQSERKSPAKRGTKKITQP